MKTINVLLMAALFGMSGMVNAFGDHNQNQGQGQGQGQQQGQIGINKSHNSNSNRNYNTNFNSQGQHQGQGQGQGQQQGNVGLGSGNETTINQSYTEDYSEMYDDYTPPAYAPSMGVSAPCKVGISGGGGIPGISITAGGYVTDEKCVEAETIRMGLQSGDKNNAAKANALLQMRLDAALAERKVDNEEDGIAAILAAPAPVYAEVSAPAPRVAVTGNNFLDNMH